MKKTTAFARRRARQGLPASSIVLCAKDYRKPWLTANGSRDYSDEANRADFDRIMLDIRLQLERITSGVVPQDDVEPHDLLAHVVGITQIRVFDIGAACRSPGFPSRAWCLMPVPAWANCAASHL